MMKPHSIFGDMTLSNSVEGYSVSFFVDFHIHHDSKIRKSTNSLSYVIHHERFIIQNRFLKYIIIMSEIYFYCLALKKCYLYDHK